MDTIFALATARGKAGVAIIRISGPTAREAAGSFGVNVPSGGRHALRTLRSDGDIVDHALVLSFDEGHSFTGDEVVELHVHGSRAVVDRCLQHLGSQPGCRLAEAGEFTRRALINGQLSLTQVEALGDLIEAETEAQHRLAMSAFCGAIQDAAERIRVRLIEALSLLEVTIDFADEEVPVDVMPDVRAALNEVLEWIDAELVGLPAAELVRDGFEVAIVGPPNAGKSTLLNCLAGREAAITSDIAGTTRDVIEVRMDLGGYAVTFLDTAGLRDSSDPVEKIGIERGVIRAKAADMRVFLGSGFELIPEAEGDLIVLPKVDTAVSSLEGVSGKTGAGVADLLERIESVVSDRVGGLANATHDRHADALRGMKQVLSSAMRQVDRDAEPELTSQEIREALASLDALLGRTDVEDVLDVIFSNFCLGK